MHGVKIKCMVLKQRLCGCAWCIIKKSWKHSLFDACDWKAMQICVDMQKQCEHKMCGAEFKIVKPIWNAIEFTDLICVYEIDIVGLRIDWVYEINDVVIGKSQFLTFGREFLLNHFLEFVGDDLNEIITKLKNNEHSPCCKRCKFWNFVLTFDLMINRNWPCIWKL